MLIAHAHLQVVRRIHHIGCAGTPVADVTPRPLPDLDARVAHPLVEGDKDIVAITHRVHIAAQHAIMIRPIHQHPAPAIVGMQQALAEVATPRMRQRLRVVRPVGEHLAVAVGIRPRHVQLGSQEQVVHPEGIAPFGTHLPGKHGTPVLLAPVADGGEGELVKQELPIHQQTVAEAVARLRPHQGVAARVALRELDRPVEDERVEEIDIKAIAPQLIAPHDAFDDGDVEPRGRLETQEVERHVLLGKHPIDGHFGPDVVHHGPQVDVAELPEAGLQPQERVVHARIAEEHAAVPFAHVVLTMPQVEVEDAVGRVGHLARHIGDVPFVVAALRQPPAGGHAVDAGEVVDMPWKAGLCREGGRGDVPVIGEVRLEGDTPTIDVRRVVQEGIGATGKIDHRVEGEPVVGVAGLQGMAEEEGLVQSRAAGGITPAEGLPAIVPLHFVLAPRQEACMLRAVGAEESILVPGPFLRVDGHGGKLRLQCYRQQQAYEEIFHGGKIVHLL